jgi:PEGA domain
MSMRLRFLLAIALVIIAGATVAGAQDESKPADQGQSKSQKSKSGDTGKVHVSVKPDEAYIWVDGKPVTHRNTTLKLPAGEHKVAVYNYGYEPQVHNVTVTPGQSQDIQAHLKAVGKNVSGPWGRIQIERAHVTDLVFLNGTTPEFFVGHVDEMNNHIIGEQQLIVPVGKHTVHVIESKTGKEFWSGPVEVKENKRVIIYTIRKPDKQLVYKDWPEGKKLNALRRFEAGTATARIVVAPVTAKLALDQQNIQCDQPVKVSWTSTDAANTTIKANDQPVAYSPTGSLDAQPKQTTKYEFRAAGPGGIVTQDATVNVDNTIKASLTPVASEIRYVKVGDTVQEQGSTELKWSASNASNVTIDPVGTVTGTGGSQTITASPQKTTEGPIDETVTYKLTATNDCGGSETQTASVHLTGNIGPVQVAAAEPPPPQPELPATASPLPLLAVLGAFSLGVGSMLRRMKK